jgi:hypothetical protein
MCMKKKESMTIRPSEYMRFSRKCTTRDLIDNILAGFLAENAGIVVRTLHK